ncbi:MAG: NfeD family protein [Pseudomonadota bacterium]
MAWWMWMVLGAVILGAELMVVDAQFYLVFIGISAALVGLADLVGINMPEWAQWTAFGVISLISFFTFRQTLYEKIRGGVEGFRETLDGDTIRIQEDLAAGAEARVEFRGSKWTTRNVGGDTIAAGTRAKVVRVDGLTLHVEPE